MGIVLSIEDCMTLRSRWRSERKTVVFTNGCFDLLHPGHVRLLERARECGDILLVAINSDQSVSAVKGLSRPVQQQQHRAGILASLEAVDAVTIFDENTPCLLLERLLPNILVKGSDWNHCIIGREIVEKTGGRVFSLPFEKGYSTTDIVRIILEQSL